MHDHDHHHHDHDHHSPANGPGDYAARAPAHRRDYRARAFTVGIGGPVGSGKTALVLALCRALRERIRLGVVTNDIYTREDAEFLHRHGALALRRRAFPRRETAEARTPITASINLNRSRSYDELMAESARCCHVESGCDNLTSPRVFEQSGDYHHWWTWGGLQMALQGRSRITSRTSWASTDRSRGPRRCHLAVRAATRPCARVPVVFAQSLHAHGSLPCEHVLGTSRRHRRAVSEPRPA